MSPALESVARFALTERYALATMSLDEVAEACKVSKSSVIRFCCALGYDGFRSFRQALIREQLSLHGEPPGDHKSVGAPAFVSSPSAVLSSLARSLDISSQMLDCSAFAASVEIISSAQNVIWFGVGDSGFLAMSGSHRFSINGIGSKAIYSSDELRALSRHQNDQSVLICISRSGRLPSVLDAVRTIRESGHMSVVAVTGDPGAPLSQMADHVLTTAPIDLYAEGQRTTLQSTQMAIIDALVAGVLHARHPSVKATGVPEQGS